MQLQLNTNRSAARCSRRDQRSNSITHCFDAMRSNSLIFSARRASGVILPMIAALLLLATVPQMGLAQSNCPTPPSGCPSYTEAIVMASIGGSPLGAPDSASCPGGSSCCAVLSICYMCCGGQIYSSVGGIDVQNNNCLGYTADQLLDWAQWYAEWYAIYQYYGQGGTCDPKLNSTCPGGSTVVNGIFSQCWELNTVTGNDVYTSCQNGGYCNISFNLCYNPITGQLQTSDYTYSSTGSTCPTEPVPPNPWTANTCYTVLCPDGRGFHQ